MAYVLTNGSFYVRMTKSDRSERRQAVIMEDCA